MLRVAEYVRHREGRGMKHEAISPCFHLAALARSTGGSEPLRKALIRRCALIGFRQLAQGGGEDQACFTDQRGSIHGAAGVVKRA